MGVISCSRRNCENIMCDTSVPGCGNICFECQKEFIKYVTQNRIVIHNDLDIQENLSTFMDSSKSYSSSSDTNYIESIIINYFNEYTR